MSDLLITNLAEIATPEGNFTVHSPLVGAFNLENILLAIGAGIVLKLTTVQIQTGRVS